jgi:C-terminal processing protease CtpA/Prc
MEPEADDINDPILNFESMWNTLNERYAYFTYKNIDWDSVRLALEVKIQPDMSQEALFDVMAEMLYALQDGHVNLFSPFDVSRNWEWYLNHPANFSFDVVQREYLGPDHRRSGPLLNSFLAEGRVGYVYYGSFANQVRDEHIDFIIDRFADTDAIIFDVRDNGGGSINNVEQIVSRFADEPRHVYSIRYKEGPDPDDFSESYPKIIGPKGSEQYTKPIYVLSNRKSYSATSFFLQSMRAFPNVTIVGDQSGGGAGAPISRELPNGWVFRFSSNQALGPNGFNFEGGVPVDIKASATDQALAEDRDPIIDVCLDLILEED